MITSPLINLKKAFLYRNIDLPDNLVARDMGMKNYDHIVSLSYEPAFKDMFFSVYGRRHEDNDLGDIYSIDNALQRESLKDKVKIIPEAKHACDFLRNSNIKIGITTGFNKEQMDLCIRILNKSGIYPDSAVSSACLPVVSRPEPYLIRENMKQLLKKKLILLKKNSPIELMHTLSMLPKSGLLKINLQSSKVSRQKCQNHS